MKKTELKVYVLIYAFGWNSFWAQMTRSCYIYVLEINLVHTKSKLGYQGKKSLKVVRLVQQWRTQGQHSLCNKGK